MDNPDRLLRHFLKIAELKSLSRAADALDLTQSGLSRSLAALEAYLGKSLFLRTGRGVELTQAGEKLLEAAIPAYTSIDAALQAVRDREGISEGQVRLAVIHTLSYYFMADIVAEFVSKHPRVNLSLLGRSSSEVVALVEGGKADLGFLYDSAVDTDTVASTPLFEDEMCIIASADEALPDELDLTKKRFRFVAFPAHYALGKMLQTSGLGPEIVAEAETVDAMLRLISSRVGICVLPERIPDRLIADYRLKKSRIIRPRMSRLVVAIVSNNKAPPPLVYDLIQTARANAG
ncbi:LysR family transcriptional regulator [Ochrobactrum vermis]|uniref:LysR family transcriptional regulator n=1 Tax=Ochrobactrum vermis TaxID=1827297 RepID=A0ABU8PMT3_9HYPH|nr:LysR family transcriptional regulator [Ochrobactrum vermis]PQZ24298.1 LysR family transcriptional regulator [Ochrobactrum vermis]